MRRVLAGTLLVFFGLSSVGAFANDCTLGTRYIALANDRSASGAIDDAVQFLQKAIDACPTYEAYEKLGETLAQSTDVADAKRAVTAFVSAYDLAPSDKARARTLSQYAKLLNSRGDAQNASPLILQARALDGTDTEIRALAVQIDAQVAHPTAEGITRGLKESLYVPLRRSYAATEGGGGTTSVHAAPPSPSINIRINFETGSTTVDPDTRQNVAQLAEALRNPKFADNKFIFVGHADERGSAASNQKLSEERAQAIYRTVLGMDPSLEGRVRVTGRGSSEPLDPRHDTDAYRVNRRLQVLLQ